MGEMKPVTMMTSEDLGVIFASLRSSLRNYLRRHVSDICVAEDLLQDIFVKALAAIKDNRAPKNPAGWLYAAARTTVVDYYRSSRSGAKELDEDLPDTQHADDELLHQELAMCLRPLAQKLPAIYRDTLLATDLDGQTMRSLAKAQGLSVSAIKSRASRARRMLKASLLDCCHVEVADGMVIDYGRRSSEPCKIGCASVAEIPPP